MVDPQVFLLSLFFLYFNPFVKMKSVYVQRENKRGKGKRSFHITEKRGGISLRFYLISQVRRVQVNIVNRTVSAAINSNETTLFFSSRRRDIVAPLFFDSQILFTKKDIVDKRGETSSIS